MRHSLAVLILAGLTACARGGPAPVAPVTAGSSAEESPSPVQTVAVTPTSPADPPAAEAAQTPAAQAAAARVRRDSATGDTLQQEAEFLDSLRALAADTLHRQALSIPVAPEAVRREAATLFGRPEGSAASATWDIDVATYASHERVQYWMDYFGGRSRWHFERYIERAGRYDSMIRTRLAASGMPQDMIYLAMIESGFAQNIRSRAGAVGLWQFIPATGRRYGLTVDAWVDERRDPYLATDAAIRFLSELNNRFGSWYLAAAAYNSGPGKIQRGLARGDYGALNGNDAFFAMAEGHFLRRETRDYVPKLIAAALLAKEPARYGFTGLDIWSPMRYDSVQAPFAVGLDVVARLAHTTRDVMEDMNPMFFRGVTPPDRRAWLRVPLGTADSVNARLATLPPGDRVTVIVHLVGRGETLSRIARQYGVTVSDIQSANHLRTTRLARGQRLVIPTSIARLRSVAGEPRGTRRTRLPSTSRTTAASRLPARSAASAAPTATTRRVHVVRSGESPASIAAGFHVPVDALLAANGLNRRSVIRPGQSIRIPN
jgi:membrane-bound lytic murein transglycosylase D